MTTATELDNNERTHSDGIENHWVGAEKERYDFVLKYIGGNVTSRGYSAHKFEDRKGRKFLAYSDFCPNEIEVSSTWSGSPDGPNVHKLVPGDCFTCKATVTRHDVNDYKVDVPFRETVLNRIKYGDYLGRKDDN